MHGMGQALVAMSKVARKEEPLSIYYAFKQSEVAEDGVTSAGWASFLQAVANGGLAVNGTLPPRTEVARRTRGEEFHAPAPSIVLHRRQRPPEAAGPPRR